MLFIGANAASCKKREIVTGHCFYIDIHGAIAHICTGGIRIDHEATFTLQMLAEGVARSCREAALFNYRISEQEVSEVVFIRVLIELFNPVVLIVPFNIIIEE
jgi:hypothetical protein